ncbi:hypothetical protein WN944_027613 [Citrus x changshan-huyou]|uniref:Uncharacterized protein n=1 Tax=Citrus x changshan-huyou TaxID=2935761 RepID=A0AAP0LIB2_9ROSI
MRHVSHLLKTAAEVSVFDSKMDEVLTRVQRLFQMAVKASAFIHAVASWRDAVIPKNEPTKLQDLFGKKATKRHGNVLEIGIKNKNADCLLNKWKHVQNMQEAVDPAYLRDALIAETEELEKSIWRDASAFLTRILGSVHKSTRSGVNYEDDCLFADCFVNRIFGLNLHYRGPCSHCKTKLVHSSDYGYFFMGPVYESGNVHSYALSVLSEELDLSESYQDFQPHTVKHLFFLFLKRS